MKKPVGWRQVSFFILHSLAAMLYLLFQLGKERYALEAGQAIEVIPYVALKPLPHAPQGVAGLFNYRGRPVPAVDLCALTLGRPAHERLSTRIIVVSLTDPQGRSQSTAAGGVADTRGAPERASAAAAGVPPQDPAPRLYAGLIAEHATGMIRREPGQFVPTGVALSQAPHLGPVLLDEQGVIQMLHPEHLLTEHVRQLLRAEIEAK